MIRDRIEFGTNSTKVREKLTSKGSVLTLDKAVEEQHGYKETVAAPTIHLLTAQYVVRQKIKQTLFEILSSEDCYIDLPENVQKVKLNLFSSWYVIINIV